MADQVHQVFYIVDPRNKKRHVVMPSKMSIVSVDGVVSGEEYNNIDKIAGPSKDPTPVAKDAFLPEQPYMRSHNRKA